MTYTDLRKQLELDLEWRQKEMRLLYNQLSNIPDEDDKRSYCKALTVMLYSHYEGFCKLAFSIYIDIVNNEGLTCSQANNHIAAYSLIEIFQAAQNPNKKCGFFIGSPSPPHKKLHRFHRQVYLISELDCLLDQPINLDDSVANTEANLKIPVLGKILYYLGFPYNTFDPYLSDISNLVDRRIDYAHGEKKSGITEEMYKKFETSAFKLMSELITLLDEAWKNKSYLKVTPDG